MKCVVDRYKWHRPFQMATTVYEREICCADLGGTKGKCLLTGGVRLWEVKQKKSNRGHIMHHNKSFKAFKLRQLVIVFQGVDGPSTTPVGQDRKVKDLRALL